MFRIIKDFTFLPFALVFLSPNRLGHFFHLVPALKSTAVDGNCTNDTWKWFKGCLGALDGTHISVHVPTRDKAKYRTRKGILAVNVLGVCNHNMNFIYALTGWEGSTTDARVLRNALTREVISSKFQSLMPDDPLEEFEEEYSTVAGESQAGFITTVQPSELWDDWREKLALSMWNTNN
ncbi:uncharacterized protein [Henckelia pumila]|uniref:uncharacterized protein n=1 Tax=Henckelia pumila TaxID=405737 RepID=UPI003C6E4DF1